MFILALRLILYSKDSPLKKGEIYQFKILEEERLRIANELQNQGYYQFNKRVHPFYC